MIWNIVFCVFLCLSLVAVQVDDDNLSYLKRRYADYDNVFECYPTRKKTLEIRYSNKDLNIFGLCWDTFMGDDIDQESWQCVGAAMTISLFFQKPISESDMAMTLQRMQKLFLEGHPSMRPLPGRQMIDARQMEDIVNPQPGAWVLRLKSGALDDRAFGTLSISAANTECSLVRVPELSPPVVETPQERRIDPQETMLQETMLQETMLQETMLREMRMLHTNFKQLSENINKRFDSMDKRLRVIEERQKTLYSESPQT